MTESGLPSEVAVSEPKAEKRLFITYACQPGAGERGDLRDGFGALFCSFLSVSLEECFKIRERAA